MPAFYQQRAWEMLLLLLFSFSHGVWELSPCRKVIQKISDIREWQLSRSWREGGVIEAGKEGNGMFLTLRGTHLAYGIEGGLEARRPGGSLVWSSR